MEPGGNGALRAPDERTVRDLLDWRPDLGVISVYVAIDPAERGEPWRGGLRNQLKPRGEADEDKQGRRRALEATAERIKAHFPDDQPPSGRFHVGSARS